MKRRDLLRHIELSNRMAAFLFEKVRITRSMRTQLTESVFRFLATVTSRMSSRAESVANWKCLILNLLTIRYEMHHAPS